MFNVVAMPIMAIMLSTTLHLDASDKMVNDSGEVNAPVVVQVSGNITEMSAKQFVEQMENAQATGQPVIPIVISSFGGSVHAMLEMIDAIKSSKVPVATIAVGKAMSAGAALLTCGAEGLRYAAPHATIMIHEVSSGSMGKTSEIKASAEETDRLNKLMLRIMSENIGKHKSYLSDIIHTKGHADWFITPEQALEHGIINKIGVPDLWVKIKVEVDLH